MDTPKVAPMTSRERVLAALKREPVDRTPLCNPTSVATVELMDLVNAPFPDANRQPELMARLAARLKACWRVWGALSTALTRHSNAEQVVGRGAAARASSSALIRGRARSAR